MGETIDDTDCAVCESSFIPVGYCIAVIGNMVFSGSLDDLQKETTKLTMVILSPDDSASLKEYTRARRN